MGFSLKMFFSDLIDILDDESLDSDSKLHYLEELVASQIKYAKECGQLA